MAPVVLHPARGSPQTELDMGPDGEQAEETAQEPFPHDLDLFSLIFIDIGPIFGFLSPIWPPGFAP